jgi:hypothetical protein
VDNSPSFPPFQFFGHIGVSPSDKATVEQRILTERARLERALSEGDAQLAAFSKEILPRRKALEREALSAAEALLGAEADFASDGPIGRLVTGGPPASVRS